MAKAKTDYVQRCKELGIDPLVDPCPERGTQEWSAWMNARRQLNVGGRAPGRRRSRKQREAEFKELMGKLAKDQLESVRHIAVQNLKDLLYHPDAKIRQSTALAILERTDGKPTQVVETTGEVTTKIVYETAAVQIPDFIPVPVSDEVHRELEQRRGD